MKKNLFILSAGAMLLFACGTHKAHHKGISYSKMPTWKANKKAESIENQEFQADLKGGQEEVVKIEQESFIEPIFASADEGLSALINDDQHLVLENEIRDVTLAVPVKAAPSDSCDEIILRNGDIVSGKITELNPTQIKYKKCDYLAGPTVVINKDDVFMLRYSNGSKEVFNQAKAATSEAAQPNNAVYPNEAYFEAKRTESMVNWGIANGVLGLFPILGFPLSAIAIIFGASGMKKTSNKKSQMDPKRRKAIAAFVLGLIGAAWSIIAGMIILFW